LATAEDRNKGPVRDSLHSSAKGPGALIPTTCRNIRLAGIASRPITRSLLVIAGRLSIINARAFLSLLINLTSPALSDLFLFLFFLLSSLFFSFSWHFFAKKILLHWHCLGFYFGIVISRRWDKFTTLALFSFSLLVMT
jgi:hypothetical protein